ncbi:MAG TPA: MBL fold metallo-hydrolase [Acidimicrobiia bacterium]
MSQVDLPRPESLGDGIHIVPVPLPFKSPPWVNTYVVETESGLLLIDCGADWPEGRIALSEGFRTLGLDEAAVHTLLVSHLHPDHVGMADRMREELGCRVVMHERAEQGRLKWYNDTPGYMSRLREVALRHGAPKPAVELAASTDRPDYMPILDPPDHVVADGDRIDLGRGRQFQVLHTPGHDDAHICLRDSRTGILFSGDHILPRITPVVPYDPDIPDVLADYIQSLRRLIALQVGVTYPAHGTLIARGDERAHQILLHHDRRLLDMMELVRREDSSAFEVMLKSFRSDLSALQIRLAMLETIAHLEHLRLQGRISATERDGVVVYTR